LINEMEHPVYSPHLAWNDFWLFPKIKSALKGLRFQDTEDIKNVTTLKAIQQQEFQKMFQHWQHHWAKCIAAQGEHLKVTPLSRLYVYRYACNKIIPGIS